MSLSMYEMDFNESFSPSRTKMVSLARASRIPCRTMTVFLSIVNREDKFQDDRYQLAVPFRKPECETKENRDHQVIRTLGLKVCDAASIQDCGYVDSRNNSADDASVRLNCCVINKSHCWFRGPEFLWQAEECWPQNCQSIELASEDPEVKVSTRVIVGTRNRFCMETNRMCLGLVSSLVVCCYLDLLCKILDISVCFCFVVENP